MDVFAVGVQTWAGTTTRGERHDVQAMLEYLLLLLSLLGSAVRDREALVAENLLLRHQLTVLTRPTRKRPRPWQARAGARQRHRQPDCRLGLAAGDRGDAFGATSRGICCTIGMPSMAMTSAGAPSASVSTVSPRRFTRQGKRHHRTSHRDATPRVPRPPDCLG